MSEHTHEQYFAKLTQHCKDNPNWANDLAAQLGRQRRSPSYKQGQEDGWHGKADPTRLTSDSDYAAGVEEGEGLYNADVPLL